MFFWLQKPPNPFFPPCKKDLLCHIEDFNSFSKSSWTSVNSTTLKFVKGLNLFSFREKKDPGRKPNLPHKPGEARTFFASAKKGSGVRKINFLVAKSSQNHFLFGGKKVSVSRPRKYINFGFLDKGSTQNARSGTRVFKTRVPNAKPYRRNMLRF